MLVTLAYVGPILEFLIQEKMVPNPNVTAFGLSPASAVVISARKGTCSNRIRGLQRHDYRLLSEGRTIVCRRNAGKSKDKRRGDGRRPFQVGELIRREISPIIEDAFSAAFDGESDVPVLVSVVDVTCSPDLRNARVSISVLGSEDQKKLVLKWLKNARKSIRFELAQCLHMKYVPELQFGQSEVAQATKTVNILEMLAHEREEKAKRQAGVAVVSEPFSFDEDMELNADAAGAILDDDLLVSDSIAPSYTTSPDFSMFNASVGTGDANNEEPLIVDIGDNDEDLEEMSDENVRKLLFRRLDEEDGTAD